MTVPKPPARRPIRYSEGLVQTLCERLIEGETLRAICKDPAMPSRSSVYHWLQKYEPFRNAYLFARQLQADAFADQIVDIAFETENVPLAKLQIDALKWHASKTAPRRYGEKVDPEAMTFFLLPIKGPDPNSGSFIKIPADLSRLSFEELYALIDRFGLSGR